MSIDAFFRLTSLDHTTWPEFRDQIQRFDSTAPPGEPRRYPGLPLWPLPRARARLWPSLDRVLARRRCVNQLAMELPSKRDLGRLLHFSHGITGQHQRGPTPSSGGLQSLELYAINLGVGWLPSGVYHYDRAGHHLTQLQAGAQREVWETRIPSLSLVEGGALVWLIVGDGARIAAKYDVRGGRFLCLEAGHLMQNLCLLSASLGLCTVPLGGFFEGEIARVLRLVVTDLVTYTGVCGTAK